MPRSAFLEGARKAGGTKTCTGAIAKQKTAVPQGAASLSLAVLESDGRKREVAIDSPARWGLEGAGGQTSNAENVRSDSTTGDWVSDGCMRPGNLCFSLRLGWRRSRNSA